MKVFTASLISALAATALAAPVADSDPQESVQQRGLQERDNGITVVWNAIDGTDYYVFGNDQCTDLPAGLYENVQGAYIEPGWHCQIWANFACNNNGAGAGNACGYGTSGFWWNGGRNDAQDSNCAHHSKSFKCFPL